MAPIVLLRLFRADGDFNQATPHPADPIKCRTSTQRTQAPESVDTRKSLSPLTHERTVSANSGHCRELGKPIRRNCWSSFGRVLLRRVKGRVLPTAQRFLGKLD